MKVITVKTGFLQENCYIISGDNGTEAILIDPGADAEKIASAMRGAGLAPKAVLLTHAHFDHIGAAKYFQDASCGVYLHGADYALIPGSIAAGNYYCAPVASFAPDKELTDGQKLRICGLDITVLHTPGHSEGGVCYIIENAIFSGDTLFYLSIGRTDFETGDDIAMRASLGRLFALSGDYVVYPGHGQATSLEFERKNNPYA